MPDLRQQLRELASSHGIHLTYWDVTGTLVHATDDGLLRVLAALGAPVGRLDDVPDALRQRRRDLWRRAVEPVHVAWDGRPPEVILRCPTADLGRPRAFTLAVENGPTYTWTMKLADLPSVDEADVEGVRSSARRLSLIGPYPLGYHRLTVEGGGEPWRSVLIAAPTRPGSAPVKKTWGVFCPLYALYSRESWGSGDFKDLETLATWVQARGGGLAATLPLLAAQLDDADGPSPYSPVSRLFWNEFYLHLPNVPEVQEAPEAKRLFEAAASGPEVASMRAAPLVDCGRLAALKRRVLEAAARALFAGPSPRRAAFETFLREHPRLDDYAHFRSVGEALKTPWQAWPTPLRDGRLGDGDGDAAARRYHQYVQWLAAEQLRDLAQKARANGPGLYLDLPLGVGPSSYDVWRERHAFAADVAAGAPPDPFFAKGQNWGFPPLHPERMRDGGYPYLRAYLRHHLGLAGILRIDHMMGLHRLYWIPKGADAKDGTYVGYRAEEQYAVFTLEAHRSGSVLVGEDLGTVPEEVPPMMAKHDIHRMYVLQYQAQPRTDALAPIFAGAVASLNTHDMPTFAAFWDGLDIEDRVDLNILTREQAAAERTRRTKLLREVENFLTRLGYLKPAADRAAVLRACLAFLATGPGLAALANLEDFWLETQPQNVPGTWRERPNWRRRAKHSLEEMMTMTEVLEGLAAMDRATKAGGRGP